MTAPTLSAMRGASFKDKLAVLEATELGGFEFVPAIGSCAGLLISNERFGEQ